MEAKPSETQWRLKEDFSLKIGNEAVRECVGKGSSLWKQTQTICRRITISHTPLGLPKVTVVSLPTPPGENANAGTPPPFKHETGVKGESHSFNQKRDQRWVGIQTLTQSGGQTLAIRRRSWEKGGGGPS